MIGSQKNADMTKEHFDFWQDHSIKFLEMAFKSDHMEHLANPDGERRHTGVCGNTVAISLKLREAPIAQVAFQMQGCINTIACANAVADGIAGPIKQKRLASVRQPAPFAVLPTFGFEDVFHFF